MRPAGHDEHQRTRVALAAGTALDLPARGLDAFIRTSVHYYNDESEVERFVRTVAG